MAVAVVLTVGVVVLVLVGGCVSHGEAVVSRNVVDRCERAAVGGAEQVPGAAEPRRQLTDALARLLAGRARDVGQPERARSIAEAVVPLGEGRWELAGAPST